MVQVAIMPSGHTEWSLCQVTTMRVFCAMHRKPMSSPLILSLACLSIRLGECLVPHLPLQKAAALPLSMVVTWHDTHLAW